ncbi:hypothetical protein J6590_012069 [Homalodisca vitripennis]|nr:hypothetical protein J6590_012069 [Homalodisca vitripennis]
MSKVTQTLGLQAVRQLVLSLRYRQLRCGQYYLEGRFSFFTRSAGVSLKPALMDMGNSDQYFSDLRSCCQIRNVIRRRKSSRFSRIRCSE